MTDNRYNELQQAVIGILILYARIRPQLMPRLEAGDFTDEPAAELFRYVQKYPDAEYTVITGGIRKLKNGFLRRYRALPLAVIFRSKS